MKKKNLFGISGQEEFLALKQLEGETHRICPTCNHRINKIEEVEFLVNVGECANCDSIRVD